ncbi:hypothetical protein M427DRAFT_290898 [Gonapodya prolifera JEL478]|uniref:Uncharacterized protein n=1 Tax=Gonapodya prolifera (strain JEL478) TaxID=1344416 RepID=A0A139AI84_GONPJ|nr:hypothetical protein M427DRAFT_290898 [Gonapodya prolifera JEL478]|eukprot:KXS16458.1 hypothetical protein M427DRAFT_290898 [Gonapodya prolifera JEL478]
MLDEGRGDLRELVNEFVHKSLSLLEPPSYEDNNLHRDPIITPTFHLHLIRLAVGPLSFSGLTSREAIQTPFESLRDLEPIRVDMDTSLNTILQWLPLPQHSMPSVRCFTQMDLWCGVSVEPNPSIGDMRVSPDPEVFEQVVLQRLDSRSPSQRAQIKHLNFIELRSAGNQGAGLLQVLRYFDRLTEIGLSDFFLQQLPSLILQSPAPQYALLSCGSITGISPRTWNPAVP